MERQTPDGLLVIMLGHGINQDIDAGAGSTPASTGKIVRGEFLKTGLC